MKIIGYVALLALVLVVVIFAAGQLGFLRGQPPPGLGVQQDRLKTPSLTPNSVSSQAGLYPDHPQRSYAEVTPFKFVGDGKAALHSLAALLEANEGCVLVKREPDYLYAQCTTRWLKFTDDVEFFLDKAAAVIHVRSASRLGQKDLGVNRARVEALRARFEQNATTNLLQK
ncbi:DUF1499 domain-containing protein [Polaromonas sp.]|uniref:DUF1499 domain-containing protein n=1 Tax=Polaromonas sp. TaxID=1869339 RepID=UPI0017DDAA1F|nr:DUF1499 domain-containing protein [Polaromonas sp.]NMM04999.1 DUF1499 domain-containing protein [Polaromonas sp.]